MAVITVSDIYSINNEHLVDELSVEQMKGIVGGAIILRLNNIDPNQVQLFNLLSMLNSPNRKPITIRVISASSSAPLTNSQSGL